MTAQAEVQLAQGQPWLALRTLDAAAATDQCYARIHLIRSEALRIDSMYASERTEVQRAYEIDPTDSDVQRAWKEIVLAAHEVESIDQSLSTSNDFDPEARNVVDASKQR